MDDSVTPIDSRPRLIKGDVNYTQIVVDRARALDGTIHDVMFVSTGGSLGKNMGTSSSGSVVKNPPANARVTGDKGSIPGLWRSPGGGNKPIPVFLPGKFHGQSSLAGYSPWGRRVGHD